MGGEAGRVPVAGVAGDTAEAGGGDEHVGFMVVGFARELRGPAAESGQCLIEGVEAADLAAAKAGEADEDAGVDFDDEAAGGGEAVHRPNGHSSLKAVEEAHAGEAGLRHLRGTDRVVEGRGLAATAGIKSMLADAVMEEVCLYPVRRAEIEMAAVVLFEEARGA